MSKVKELRQKLLEIDNNMGEQTIDLLIAAAKEEERRRILRSKEGWAHGGHFGLLWLGKHELKEGAYLVLSGSLLAPATKDEVKP